MATTYKGRTAVENGGQLQNAIKSDLAKMEKDIRGDMDKASDKILDKIGAEAVVKVRSLVIEYFYNKVPQGDNYTRLVEDGGFLDTIRYKKDRKNKKIEIYCNWKFLYSSSTPMAGDKFSPHYGFDGKKFTQGLYDYVICGLYTPPSGNNHMSGDIPAENWDGMEDIMNKELSRFFNTRVDKELGAYMKRYFGVKNIRSRVGNMGGKSRYFSNKK